MSATETLIVVAAWLVFLSPGVVTALKGQTALFFAGLGFGGIVWLIAAIRLARPNSRWARRRYGADKAARSRSRYPQVDPDSPSAAFRLMVATFGILSLLVVVAFTAAADT